MKKVVFCCFASVLLNAQSIDISKFYYRDYLDFGQNKGAFSGNGSTTITGKDGTKVSVPNVPNFSASSNNGNLAAVGRGFVVTANHVTSPENPSSSDNFRKWGLTTYTLAKQNSGDDTIVSVSKPYGRDEKFLRFDKYIVEGQTSMLDITNSTNTSNPTSTAQESQNLEDFKNKIKSLADSNGNVHIYQAGSGIITLRGGTSTEISRLDNGETKGGGFGILNVNSSMYLDLVKGHASGDSRGITFTYSPNGDFNNRISSGDSGSGIYAYDSTSKKWILLGVTSQSTTMNISYIAAVSNKELLDFQSNFEQKINLKLSDHQITTWTFSNTEFKNEMRGDIPQQSYTTQQLQNKDIIFSGGGTIKVQANIYRNISGYAGGFVFEKADTETTYKFTNEQGKNYFFKGSGLDIGENVKVEWELHNQSGDSLHKIGKGELIVKTDYTPDTNKKENLGTLKIGEGKVTLNTDTKAFDNIYITSGRGELALKAGKAQALGAEKNGVNSVSGTTSANSYKLAQDSTDKMGFYFGTGGGKFDLAGNSLVLNTIAANDSKAIITNSDASTQSTLEIQGLGYDTDGKKTTNKADTIIHASFGDNANGTNGANLNLIYTGNKTPTTRHSERSEESISTNSVDSSLSTKAQNDSTASLIFDGHINIKGKLEATNGNIVLQGHPTTHATISDDKIREQIKNAESGTSAAMPDYMDLSKPSNLNQPDWDNRTFKFGQGITLANSALTLGRNATLEANINATNSSILFGANAKHFIDNKDGANINGSGFGYFQQVESGFLSTEQQQIANYTTSYKGTITADGTMIESHIFDLNASLNLKNKATLSADFLTLTNADSVTLASGASASIKALRLKDINNNLSSKFTLENGTKFEVKESFIFDKSTFDLNTLKTASNITLPKEYNLYAFNGSTITAATFTNTKENAEFVLDNSTFKATSVSFQSAKIGVQNGANFNAQSLNFAENSTLVLNDKATLTLTQELKGKDLTLYLDKASTLNANSLTSTGASTINLNDKAELTLTEILTSKDLTLTLSNASTFTAKTLTASGVVNLNAGANSSITLTTLSLRNGDLQNISQNVAIEKLNLTDSKANLELLNGQIPKTIDLKTNSTLRLNELNLNEFNTKGLTLTSDDSSKAHIQRLIYDAKSTQNGTKTAPQSNLVVNEKFELKNVGQNLSTTTGTTQGAQNAEKDKLEKDLFTLEFSQKLELGSGANLDISFADKVTKDNQNLIFNKDYTIFTAKNLLYNDNFNNITFNLAGSGTDFFVKGRLDKNNNAFFLQFVRENPRNFGNLNPHIKNPASSPLLESLLQHNKNDASIDKAVNMSDYTALNQRLAQIDTNLKTIANADSSALKTLPLLQKQEINARIQQNRFTTAKFALAKITNPAQKSDIVPTLLYLDENERQNRVWSGASASFFGNGSDKFSLQSVSIGYDRKLFGDEFLLGILASLTNTQLSSNELSLNPKIYTLALYSDALFRHGELQNELSFSLLNGDKGFESESGSYKSFYGFFESVYKVQTAFLPQSIKPIVLGRVNLRHFDEFSTATYKQKADDDISVDLGVGVEWLWQKESGFYSASFVAERDIYHSQKERLMSLTGAQKFVAYETNEPSFAYQLYLAGLENFKNGIYLRYGLSGFVDSKAYKGFKADVQVGYKF